MYECRQYIWYSFVSSVESNYRQTVNGNVKLNVGVDKCIQGVDDLLYGGTQENVLTKTYLDFISEPMEIHSTKQ